MTTISIARWSAIASSVLALAIFATWLQFGAALPFGALSAERESPLMLVFSSLTKNSPVAWRALLFLAAATGAAAAVLSLTLLTRGVSIEAARHLGNSMGWAALSLAYLFFVSAVPPFAAHLPASPPGLLLCDFAAFALLALAAWALVQFWLQYPRPISSEERSAFASAQQEKVINKLPLVKAAELIDHMFGFDTSSEARAARNLRQYQIASDNRLLYFLLLFEAAMVPLWRITLISPVWPAELLALIGLFGFNVLLMPTVVCVVLVNDSIKLHRALGTASERRSVDWIRAGMMINFVAMLATAALMVLAAISFAILTLVAPSLGAEVSPVIRSTIGWLAFFALGTAPLIFIVALAASILYRGTLDPRLVVGRFTLWSVLGLLLTFIFVLLERAVAMKVVEWFDLPPQTGAIAAGAAIAATFQPIRRFAEPWATTWVARLMPTAMLAGGIRHEAAVAVTDISGYTALSARDEQSALLASALVQKEARRQAETHGGRFVKSTGDGAILQFHTADEAMRAMRAIHDAVTRGAAALGMPDLKLHSGLHWGEFVEVRDGDIYGQTVNVAARIADWAKAGEIATSKVFGERLTSTSDLRSSGPQRFKNVPEPIDCFTLVTT